MSSLGETFLESTTMLLFGKRFLGLTYVSPSSAGSTEGGGDDLSASQGPVRSILDDIGDAGSFARIYGFSYQGSYYKLPRPVLFLVRSEGTPAAPEGDGLQFSTRLTGVESKDWQFGSDILVWAVDTHDVAVRLDLEVGNFAQVLLQSSTSRRDEAVFRTHDVPRDGAGFQARMIGPHQDRRY
jgi:hypothetical protein